MDADHPENGVLIPCLITNIRPIRPRCRIADEGQGDERPYARGRLCMVRPGLHAANGRRLAAEVLLYVLPHLLPQPGAALD